MDHRESIFRGVTVALTVFALTTNVAAQEFSYDKEGVEKGFKDRGYSPYAGRNFPTQVYFGDTHLHTAISGDAFGFGNKLNDEDALRFAPTATSALPTSTATA